jgi:hypothetical protein
MGRYQMILRYGAQVAGWGSTKPCASKCTGKLIRKKACDALRTLKSSLIRRQRYRGAESFDDCERGRLSAPFVPRWRELEIRIRKMLVDPSL